MKKISFFVLLMFTMLLIINPNDSYASSSGNTSIILNGNKLDTTSVADVENMNGTIMIPIRVVTENLKYKVTWNQEEKTVEIVNQDKTILLTIGSKNAIVDGETYKLSIAPQISKSTALVPLRFVGDQTGLKVSWDNHSKTVSLITKEQDNSNTDNNTNNNGDTNSNNNNIDSSNDNGSISNISFANNQLTVMQTKNVQPNISTLSNPNRIVVDIPNMVLDGSMTTGLAMEKLDITGQANVTEIRYSQFSTNPNTVRIVIESTNKLNYSLDLSDSSMIKMNFSVSESNNTNNGTSSKKLIIIDAGHGGSDPGAVSVNNRFEKNFTLPVALKVRDLLKKQANIEVVMTRDADVYPTLKDRSDLANKLNADVFISIHGNKAVGAPAANGTETYYYKSAKGKELASNIHKNLIKALGLKDRGVKEANYHVLRETKMPAALLEIGFLSNYSDEKLMFTDSFQDKAAQAIVKGILEFLN